MSVEAEVCELWLPTVSVVAGRLVRKQHVAMQASFALLLDEIKHRPTSNMLHLPLHPVWLSLASEVGDVPPAAVMVVDSAPAARRT